jgi:hypothetical protein
LNTTIHKQVIKISEKPYEITVPTGSIMLAAQCQHGELTVWYHFTAGVSTQTVFHFLVVRTGWETNLEGYAYLDTIQRGPYIWHVFFAEVPF